MLIKSAILKSPALTKGYMLLFRSGHDFTSSQQRLFKIPMGIKSGSTHNRFQPFQSLHLIPPNAHMAQTAADRKRTYGPSISFQYGVLGRLQGERKTTVPQATKTNRMPAQPGVHWPLAIKTMDRMATQLNPPIQPASQPIFSPRRSTMFSARSFIMFLQACSRCSLSKLRGMKRCSRPTHSHGLPAHGRP